MSVSPLLNFFKFLVINMKSKRQPSHRILKLNDIRNNWRSMMDNAEEIGTYPPSVISKEYPILGDIFLNRQHQDKYKIAHNYYFHGRVIDIINAIGNGFLTATDIAEDLYEGSKAVNPNKHKGLNLRKIRSWINTKGTYHTKYHIGNTVTLHRICDDVNNHYLSTIKRNGQSKTKAKPPYHKQSHHLILGEYRPKTVVPYNVYRDFINIIYDPNFSDYARSLQKWFKRRKKFYLERKITQDATQIISMKRIARDLRNNASIVYGNEDNGLVANAIKSTIDTIIGYAPSVPNEDRADLRIHPHQTVSKIVNKINFNGIKHFLQALRNDLQIAKSSLGTERKIYLARTHRCLIIANECHLLSKNRINKLKDEIKQLAKDNN